MNVHKWIEKIEIFVNKFHEIIDFRFCVIWGIAQFCMIDQKSNDLIFSFFCFFFCFCDKGSSLEATRSMTPSIGAINLFVYN